MTMLSANRVAAIIERTLLAAHRQLVKPGDNNLVEAVLERLTQALGGQNVEPTDEAIARATKFAFSRILYYAYFQDGSVEQEQAFNVAEAYLYPILLRELNGDEDAASDLVQQALSQVWTHGPSLREPGAFLYFLIQTGLRLVYRHRKNSARQGNESLDSRDENANPQTPVALMSLRSVEDQALDQPWQERFRELVRRCLEKFENYLKVIESHYLNGQSYKEMANAWQRPPTQLHLDKFRALAKLRECPELLDFMNRQEIGTGLAAG